MKASPSPRGLLRLTFFIALLIADAALALEGRLINVHQVEPAELTYQTVIFGPTQTLDLSDLNVWPGIVTGRDPFRAYLQPSTDLKLELLRRGWASLKDPENAPETYLEAQEAAEASGRGMWAPEPVDEAEPDPPSTIHWGAILAAGGKILLWLFSAGFIALLGRFIYTHWYIQRRVSLLLLGEPSAGKSAILERLVNPKVTREQILKLQMTQALRPRRHPHFIPKGRFEIHPTLADVPGAAFGTAWDSLMGGFLRRSSALLLVLAPTQAAHGDGEPRVDEKYVYTQLGYVQAYVAGGLTSRSTRKPRVVILYLNKFDLFSGAPPSDSSSAGALTEFHRIFDEHVRIAKTAAKGASVPFKVIVGSALENWNCDVIIDEVSRELYGF